MKTMLQISVWLHWVWTYKKTQAREVQHKDLKNLYNFPSSKGKLEPIQTSKVELFAKCLTL